MIATLIVPLVLISVVALIWWAFASGFKHLSLGLVVRQVFQYLLLLGLMVTFVSGLDSATELLSGDVYATDVAWAWVSTVVGGALLFGVGWWTRTVLKGAEGERELTAWTLYLTAAQWITVGMAASRLGQTLDSVFESNFEWGTALAAVVWTAVWGVHRYAEHRTLAPTTPVVLMLGGSLVGWWVAVAALIWLVARLWVAAFGYETDLLTVSDYQVGDALAWALPALLVWSVHWFGRLRRHQDHLVWSLHLVITLTGSLALTLVGVTMTLYRGAVWFWGAPGSSFQEHLNGTGTPVAMAFIGLLSWWYHRVVLQTGSVLPELLRVYRYVLAGVFLGAFMTGLAVTVTAVIEALTAGVLLVGETPTNTGLAAASVLVVAGPGWWWQWRVISMAQLRDTQTETRAITRRVYLVAVIGIAAVVGVVTLFTAATILINDVVDGSVGTRTLIEMDQPAAAVLAAVAVGLYHWTVLRRDRRLMPHTVKTGPERVLLVGQTDEDLMRRISRELRCEVQSWPVTAPEWDADEVMAVIAKAESGHLLLWREENGMQITHTPAVGAVVTAPQPAEADQQRPDPAGTSA